MGVYINLKSNGSPLPAKGKAEELIKDGGIIVPFPSEYRPNLVCVVQNGLFDAALIVTSPDEFRHATVVGDNRPKTWLEYDHSKIAG
jgi:hypothetical protein